MKDDSISIIEDIVISLAGSSLPVPADLAPSLLPDCSQDCSLQIEVNKLRAEAAWWRSMHSKAKEREERLQNENDELKAKLKLRERQLFGAKSEQGKGKSEGQKEKEKRNRGQQPGAPGHGRKRHKDLPVKDEYHDLPDDQKHCQCCGLPFEPFPGTEDSEMVEINVRAHVRRIHRRKYKRTCSCPNLPVIVTAKAPAKLIPKGGYGDSVWIEVLIHKFLFYHPTTRLLKRVELLGLGLSQGTVTDGLKRLTPLFEPVYEELVTKSRSESHWHADETRWLVFEESEGKIGYRWYLWVFKSASTAVYILDPSRSSRVPLSHLKDIEHESILSVDRYCAYKTLVKEKDGAIRLAWCWAHVRRDFLNLARTRPAHEEWGMEWVEKIGSLYHLNNSRLELLDVPEEFNRKDADLRNALTNMENNLGQQLEDETLHPEPRKVLESLQNHWDGLTLFIDNPEIPMDNNEAERALRGPVVGRKNFYGSGASWSGFLASMLFSIFQTLLIWKINPQVWLHNFFRACAENRGETLEDISSFLPWNMSEQELHIYRAPPKPDEDTS